jgi:hypothetical protein
MQVVYTDSFNDLVKACILKEVKGYEPVMEANLKSKEFTSVKEHTMNQLLIEWNWANGTPHNVSGLEDAIRLALRHNKSSHELIFSVINQALKNGVDYVLTRRSYEAKRFCNLVRSVREELRSAKLNMKFINSGSTLLGKYVFNHKIADLLLDFYQKRFPEKQVVISNNHRAYSSDSRVSIPVISNEASIIQGVNAPGLNLKSFF